MLLKNSAVTATCEKWGVLLMAVKPDNVSRASADSLSPAEGERVKVRGWLLGGGNTSSSVALRIPPHPDPFPLDGGAGVTAFVLLPPGSVQTQNCRIARP